LLLKCNRVAIDSELLEYMEEKEVEVVRVKHTSINKHTNEYLTNKKRAEEVLASSKKNQKA
jgi:post-segregation antitoxin (ccd killing protein)